MNYRVQSTNRLIRLSMSVSAASLLVALTSPASAQEVTALNTAAAQSASQDVPQTPEEEVAEGDVTVTGTRIARDGFQAPTPLTVLTLEDIQNTSPSNNIADFVNQLPSMAGSTRPANSRLNLSSGQAGINALNLRNLGSERTLVLLDGRRSVPSTINGLVDVNTIPQALIERVEVVTGGASAAYGSDAVAGVVNFVLNKKYEGLKVSVDSGITEEGDGFNYSFGVAGGMSFAGGRGHVLLSAELAHRDGIFSVDRDWNETGFLRFENPAYNATTNSSVPFYLFVRNAGAANSTPGGLITNSAGGVANRLRGTYFGSNGEVLQYQYGALTFPVPGGSAVPLRTQGGDWRVNDSGRRIGLDPEDDRHGVFGRLSYEVTDGIELFAEGSYNRQEVFFNAGPNLATGAVLTATGCGTAATSAAAPITCNAFLYNALGPTRLQGITSVTVATTFADLPFRAVDNERETQRYTVGAEGDLGLFGKAAPWNIYGQYGRVDTVEQLRNIQNISRLAAATNVAFARAGNPGGFAVGSIQCTINLDASGANDDRACVPLNRLGLGVANPAAIPYVLGDPYREQTLEQIAAGANLSFTPFATWAGDVSFAVGAEYREEKIDGFVPDEFQPVPILDGNGNVTGASNRWSVGNYLASIGRYDVKEAYLETVVPLGLGLEFNGAVRATDYSTAGYVTTWKAGATWQPIDDIRFRVTRSRDIRAPNLNDLFQAGSANSDSVGNPGFVNNESPPFVAAGQPPQAGYSYSGFATGNPDLEPEKSDQWNVGVVLSPRFLPGFNLSVDYFDINVDQGISTFSAQQIVNLCYLGNAEFCDAISIDAGRTQNAAQPYLIIRSQPFNAASQQVRGVDIDASYRLPLDQLFAQTNGTFTIRGVATRYIENRFDSGVPQSVVTNSVGVNGGQGGTPTWIYRVNASYDTDDFSISAVGRGVSAGKYVANGIECQTTCPVSTTSAPTYESNRVSGLFYADLNVTQKIRFGRSSEAQFFVNVTNLFNREALILPETGLAANSTYSDLLGRQFRVGIRMETR
ncbi:TonB-dependent receptor plug domain-containing protein [Sphingomonas sp. AX6]|uniref:TonB-dependent receptor plug domain-containing protein n=1 Tax=Sphingomonas sp. AX6 TaxID=2653171 RepID=UPI0012F1C3EF|nr:TonB-dependent receptor [Sphingomonas sp. AX6]VXC68351.1 TonB-dependent receptor [Sphingomonas sp. AX6]